MKVIKLTKKTEPRLYDPTKSSQCVCQHCGNAFTSAWDEGVYLEHEHDGVLLSCELCPLCQKRLDFFIGHRIGTRRIDARLACGPPRDNLQEEEGEAQGLEVSAGDAEDVVVDQGQAERRRLREEGSGQDSGGDLGGGRAGVGSSGMATASGEDMRHTNRVLVHQKPKQPVDARCSPCDRSFQSRDGLRRHLEQTMRHAGANYACGYCGMKCARKDQVRTHQRQSKTCLAARAGRGYRLGEIS
ncbi:hypothetical protein BV25DRAFT_1187568 [Artomyces pyxidatus]|uniref:Uncharacterized protein n=1 Tax=Artomyces pyxidatus TaxID=48021 RepID=A0ACB8SRB4_9AGAM|nr:hypothetical protein BV25DRAFT_1187568 [Artomyces pyxidatus]